MGSRHGGISKAERTLLSFTGAIAKVAYSPIAQLAEHSTVNRRVSGSSPDGGARWSIWLKCERGLLEVRLVAN